MSQSNKNEMYGAREKEREKLDKGWRTTGEGGWKITTKSSGTREKGRKKVFQWKNNCEEKLNEKRKEKEQKRQSVIGGKCYDESFGLKETEKLIETIKNREKKSEWERPWNRKKIKIKWSRGSYKTKEIKRAPLSRKWNRNEFLHDEQRYYSLEDCWNR